MRLSPEAIKEFQEIYRREFGKTISDEEARKIAERFMNLMEIVCRPIPGVDFPIDEEKNNLVKTHPDSCWPILNQRLKLYIELVIKINLS